MKLLTIILLLFFAYIKAQDSLPVHKNKILNTQSILILDTKNIKQDSVSFKTPKYKQGIICDFEDKLNRKKVPIDFSLGNSNY